MASATLPQSANVASTSTDSIDPIHEARLLLQEAQRSLADGALVLAMGDARRALRLAMRWRYSASTGNYERVPSDSFALANGLRSAGVLQYRQLWMYRYLADCEPEHGKAGHVRQLIAVASKLLRTDDQPPRGLKPTRQDAEPMRRRDLCNVVSTVQRWTITEGGEV